MNLRDLKKLAQWFLKNQRPLPWRKTSPDPYEIWISEVMSQQSTMPTVVAYWNRWMQVFPSRKKLAKAPEIEVLKIWAGLGYYSRARNVLKAAHFMEDMEDLESAKKIAEVSWPIDHQRWTEVPGVGPYTAKAICAIAFRHSVLPIDGNVIRVIARYFGIFNPLNVRLDRQKIDERVAEIENLLQPSMAAEVAQGFMELGSLLCRPGALALCRDCPIQSGCQARIQNQVALIPAKKQSATAIKEILLVHLQEKKGRVLVSQIPAASRLAGQWELPLETIKDKKNKYLKGLKPIRHSITKYRYEAYPRWEARVPRELLGERPTRFVDPKDPVELAQLTTLSRKILAASFP